MILSRSHKHHPVATVLIRKVQPHVIRLLSILLCIQQTHLSKKKKDRSPIQFKSLLRSCLYRHKNFVVSCIFPEFSLTFFSSIEQCKKIQLNKYCKYQCCAAITYFQVNVVVLQLALWNQWPLHRTKLCALWDASLRKHSAQETVNVQDQRKTGSCFGHHRPVGDGVERTVLQTN